MLQNPHFIILLVQARLPSPRDGFQPLSIASPLNTAFHGLDTDILAFNLNIYSFGAQ